VKSTVHALALLALGFIASLSNAQTIAVIHAKAYVVPGLPAMEDATVLIKDGRIASIGPGIDLPANVRVIDAHGKIVTPGLMSSGTELGLVESGSEDTTDHAVTTGSLGPAFDVQYALNPNSTLIPLARADGLTRAITFPSSTAIPPFSGLGAVLRLSEAEDILDRSQAAMFATIGGFSTSRAGGSRSAQWLLLREVLDEAQRFATIAKDERATLSERNYSLNRVNLLALVPVIQGKIPLALGVHRESDIRQAINLARDFKLKIVICGGDEAWRVAPALAGQKIPVVLNPFDDTPSTFDQIGARLDNAAILQRAGVKISFSVPGVHLSHNAGSVIREVAGVAVANGLTWDQALRALTVNASETWGIDDHYGTLEPGKDADLVIWDGDPLEPINAPEMVLIRGKLVSLRTRQSELQERYSPKQKDNPWPPQYRLPHE
jgi:imidazolonepropionase-like amidohydrolase